MKHTCTYVGLKRLFETPEIRFLYPYLFLMDPDPDPTLDPPPFFSDFKDAKIFFFLIIYSQAHYLQSSKLKFLLKFYFASIISVRSTPL
jgi:hypothetical protein